jgi:ABC-type molybdate transport system substrate-binding protein
MVLAQEGDIFIAPEQRFMNSAIQKGAIDASTQINSIAYMIPVIGVQEGNPKNIQSLSDLAKAGTSVVMGNPDTTLLGVVVPQMLEKAGLYDQVSPNIVTNVSQVSAIITALKTGQADAGIICITLQPPPRDVDSSGYPRICNGIGRYRRYFSYSKETATAEKFIEMQGSRNAGDIRKMGYFVDATSHQYSYASGVDIYIIVIAYFLFPNKEQ